MTSLLGVKSFFHDLENDAKKKINPINDVQQELEDIKSNQLANDLQLQEKFLQDEDTEMGVSKDAINKLTNFGGLLTKIMIFAVLGYGAKKAVNYGLSGIDKGPQQEEVVNDTQENLQDAFAIDSAAIIDYHKENLSADELEEFEQFSREEQREHAQDNKK